MDFRAQGLVSPALRQKEHFFMQPVFVNLLSFQVAEALIYLGDKDLILNERDFSS